MNPQTFKIPVPPPAMALLALPLFLTGLARGQISLHPAYDQKDAPSMGFLAGIGSNERQQVLIAGRLLQGLKGKTLTELWCRRDPGHGGALASSQPQMVMHLSHARTTLPAISQAFADNAALTRTKVFDGTVSVPAAPRLDANSDLWAASNTIRLPFATAFAYKGLDLCIDIDGTVNKASTGVFWPIDFVYAAATGSAVAFGTDCTGWTASDGIKTRGEPDSLYIGATTRVASLGQPGTSTIFLLGLQPQPTGIDLAGLGAPGCRLYLQPWLQAPLAYPPPPVVGTPSIVTVQYRIPQDNALRGASAYVQFADNETALPRAQWSNSIGLTTGNGLHLQIAMLADTGLGMATVTSHRVANGQPLPGSGRVDMTAAPALRFVHK